MPPRSIVRVARCELAHEGDEGHADEPRESRNNPAAGSVRSTCSVKSDGGGARRRAFRRYESPLARSVARFRGGESPLPHGPAAWRRPPAFAPAAGASPLGDLPASGQAKGVGLWVSSKTRPRGCRTAESELRPRPEASSIPPPQEVTMRTAKSAHVVVERMVASGVLARICAVCLARVNWARVPNVSPAGFRVC